MVLSQIPRCLVNNIHFYCHTMMAKYPSFSKKLWCHRHCKAPWQSNFKQQLLTWQCLVKLSCHQGSHIHVFWTQNTICKSNIYVVCVSVAEYLSKITDSRFKFHQISILNYLHRVKVRFSMQTIYAIPTYAAEGCIHIHYIKAHCACCYTALSRQCFRWVTTL